MSVTAAKGFRASGVAAGIKPSGRSDVALVVNDGPLRAAAGVFTGNRIKAAPVMWSQQVVKGGRVVGRRPQRRKRERLHRRDSVSSTRIALPKSLPRPCSPIRPPSRGLFDRHDR